MKNLHLRIGATVVIVLAALVLSLSTFQTTTSGIKIAVAIPTPTPEPYNTKKKSPKQNAISACTLETLQQAGGMAFQGIIGPPSGPLCTKKWSFSFLGNPNPEVYNAFFPGKCYTDVGMSFVCYWSTPQEACTAKMLELNMIAPNITWENGTLTPTKDPERFDCTFRDKDAPKWTQTATIELRDRKPEFHCKEEAAGPYQNFPDYSACGGKLGKPGGYYTDTQRDTIKAANKANNMDPIKNPNGLFFKSDAVGWEYTKPEKKKCNKPSLVAGKCIEVEYLKGINGGEDLPQIDHILPRRDRTGCNCGSNTMKNAALISAQLNRALTNDPVTAEQHKWYKEGKAYPTPTTTPAP